MTKKYTTKLKETPEGISIKTTEKGLSILLKGKKYQQLGLDIEAGRKMDFYRKLKKFMSEILSLDE